MIWAYAAIYLCIGAFITGLADEGDFDARATMMGVVFWPLFLIYALGETIGGSIRK